MAKQTFTTGQVLTAAQMTSLQQTAMGGGSPSTKTASYVLVAADAGTTIQMNSSSATTITVNTSLFAAGDSLQIQNIGTGSLTITAGTATVNTAGGLAVTQWDGGFLYFSSASSAIWFDYTQSGLTNPMTTTGDMIYASSGSTPARLGIGSTGNVLTVAGGVPTWAAAGGAKPSFTLLSTTSLTGASSFTISSLSGYNTFFCTIESASVSGANGVIQFRINGDTGSNYNRLGLKLSPSSSYAYGIFEEAADVSQTSVKLVEEGSGTYAQCSGFFRIEGANSTGVKMFHSAFGIYGDSGSGTSYPIVGGYINNSSVISSITLLAGANFINGSLRIYGSVA